MISVSLAMVLRMRSSFFRFTFLVRASEISSQKMWRCWVHLRFTMAQSRSIGFSSLL